MTTAAKRTFQNEFWMGPHNGTLVKIAELRSVTPPKASRETMDATTHDSSGGAMEFIASGVYDPGTLNFSINQTPERAGQLRHLGFEDVSATGFSVERDVNGIEWELFSPAAQDAKIPEVYGATAVWR